MINSDRLASFAVFARELNFTRAARLLHISQPALHVQIQKLGEELGAPLYRRVGRGVELTPQGAQCLALAHDIATRTDAFLGAIGRPMTPKVTIAAGEGTVRYLLGDAIQKAALGSKVSLRVLIGDRDSTLNAVSLGEAHFGVIPLDGVPDGIKATPLRRVGLKVVMRRADPLAKKRRVQPLDLRGARLVLPPVARPLRREVERVLREAQVEFEVAAEATGWEVLLELARIGVGAAIVNDFCRAPKGTVARPLGGFGTTSFALIERANAERSEAAERLRTGIIDTFRQSRSG